MPNFFQQPLQGGTPIEPSLQDEIARREQAKLAPWQQGAIASGDAAIDFTKGLTEIPDNNGSFQSRLGRLVGASLPVLGAVKSIGPGPAGSGSEAMQTLLNMLWSYEPEAVTPEAIQQGLQSSKVTSTIRGNPPTKIQAPEGFAFTNPHAKYVNLRRSSMEMTPTPANEQYAKWKEVMSRTAPPPSVPKISGLGSIDDLMDLAKLHKTDEPRVDSVGPTGLRDESHRGAIKRSKVTEDDIRNIRSFKSVEEARAAYPNLNPTSVREIYTRASFPYIK